MREAATMTREHACPGRGCARLRDLVVRMLNATPGSSEHFELREAIAQLGERQGWFMADAAPELPDAACDELPDSWPLVSDEVADFRDAETRAADEVRVGDWWRCAAHGLTDDPLYLGTCAYCPAEDCVRRLLHASRPRR